MLEKMAADQVHLIAEAGRAAQEARDRLLGDVRDAVLAEETPVRGERALAADPGLDPLPRDHPARVALHDAIAALSLEAQHELRALQSIGRGVHGRNQWHQAVAASKASTDPPLATLSAEPNLHDELVKGLYELRIA